MPSGTFALSPKEEGIATGVPNTNTSMHLHYFNLFPSIIIIRPKRPHTPGYRATYPSYPEMTMAIVQSLGLCATSGYTSKRRCVVTGIAALVSANFSGSLKKKGHEQLMRRGHETSLANEGINYVLFLARLRKYRPSRNEIRIQARSENYD